MHFAYFFEKKNQKPEGLRINLSKELMQLIVAAQEYENENT